MSDHLPEIKSDCIVDLKYPLESEYIDDNSDDEFIFEDESDDDGIGLGEKAKKLKLEIIGQVSFKLRFIYEDPKKKRDLKIKAKSDSIDKNIQEVSLSIIKNENTLKQALEFTNGDFKFCPNMGVSYLKDDNLFDTSLSIVDDLPVERLTRNFMLCASSNQQSND